MMKSDMDKSAQIALLENKVEWFEKKYGHYIEGRGMKNWKNLFRRPTMYEWIILFMMVMGLFMAWAYNADVSQCKETLNNLDSICWSYCTQDMAGGSGDPMNFQFKVDNSSFGQP